MKIKVKETGEFIKINSVYWNNNGYKQIPEPEYTEEFICDEPTEQTKPALYFKNNSDRDFSEGKPIYVDDEIIKQYDYFK